jgi:hypothetical protein
MVCPGGEASQAGRMTDARPTQRAARVLADLGRMAQALEPPQRTPRDRA